jgi:hypothetical protein
MSFSLFLACVVSLQVRRREYQRVESKRTSQRNETQDMPGRSTVSQELIRVACHCTDLGLKSNARKAKGLQILLYAGTRRAVLHMGIPMKLQSAPLICEGDRFRIYEDVKH